MLTIRNVSEMRTFAKNAVEEMADTAKTIAKTIEDASFIARACSDRVALIHSTVHGYVTAGDSSKLLFEVAALAGYAPESSIDCEECSAFIRRYAERMKG